MTTFKSLAVCPSPNSSAFAASRYRSGRKVETRVVDIEARLPLGKSVVEPSIGAALDFADLNLIQVLEVAELLLSESRLLSHTNNVALLELSHHALEGLLGPAVRRRVEKHWVFADDVGYLAPSRLRLFLSLLCEGDTPVWHIDVDLGAYVAQGLTMADHEDPLWPHETPAFLFWQRIHQ
eukprot:CAMPEP_0118984154 /NCGR_PEP_ID=MMETSP1173-20130426/37254_1 /TAXON_ID=1034831 /ORGANISM="Rhizochromulina marina cf, Strain CCMP1243" /LENGTH=179 /DNA_ID=CAMNT_0006934799 /DNA_START=334 /DNA_END=869 /DNA_ORIENTATION=-